MNIKPEDIRILSWSSKERSSWIVTEPNGIELLYIPTGQSFYFDEHRSQHRNRAVCFEMLEDYLKGEQLDN